MTSTPISLNDGSLEGSWVDIRCATFSQTNVNPPIDNSTPDSMDCRSSPYCMVGNTGRVSFQVQRFLQESQKSADNLATSLSQINISQLNNINEDGQSLVYLSDTDVSQDDFDSKALYNSLKYHNNPNKLNNIIDNNINSDNINDLQQIATKLQMNSLPSSSSQQQKQSSRNGDYLPDHLSDSLSLLSRASAGVIAGETEFQEFDWLWDWTAQPEYFTGQEWKVYAPKQEYLMRQRQLYRNPEGENKLNTDVASLLVLTNVLSIIIGAGITYGILARKNGV